MKNIAIHIHNNNFVDDSEKNTFNIFEIQLIYTQLLVAPYNNMNLGN